IRHNPTTERFGRATHPEWSDQLLILNRRPLERPPARLLEGTRLTGLSGTPQSFEPDRRPAQGIAHATPPCRVLLIRRSRGHSRYFVQELRLCWGRRQPRLTIDGGCDAYPTPAPSTSGFAVG